MMLRTISALWSEVNTRSVRSGLACDRGVGQHRGWGWQFFSPASGLRFRPATEVPPGPLHPRGGVFWLGLSLEQLVAGGAPSSRYRSCQRQTVGFAMPVRRMLSTVPAPSAVAKTMLARQASLRGVLRFVRRASSSARSAGGALLHRSGYSRGSPSPRRTYPTASVTGTKSACDRRLSFRRKCWAFAFELRNRRCPICSSPE